jgi:hypothetical protein
MKLIEIVADRFRSTITGAGIITLLLSTNIADAQDTAYSAGIDLPLYGNEYTSSAYFREQYLHNDWIHYLDNQNVLIDVEQETTGNFNSPDVLVFSIAGNSYRWNKYYLDGFRLNSRIFSGSTFYQPDLSLQGLNIDYYRSAITFRTERMENSVSATYNVGGLGGIAPGATPFFHLFHRTASDAVFDRSPMNTINNRNRIRNSGAITANYAITATDGQQYAQRIYANFGARLLGNYNELGTTEMYTENFMKIQLTGELPLTLGGLFDRTNYILVAAQRDNLYNEFLFGKDETMKSGTYTASFYGSKEKVGSRYTSGITAAVNDSRHQNINFYRNAIDQDGEGFEPYYPDAVTTEISHAFTYEKTLLPNLKFYVDTYNSLIYSSPLQRDFYNPVYARWIDEEFHSLYVYRWHTAPFASGLLDNVAGIKWASSPEEWLDFRYGADITLDAMLISGKSMVRPNWQASVGAHIHPKSAEWFTMEINLAKNRVEFNYDDIRYLSDDYMSGEIYYWNDDWLERDEQFQPSEQGELMRTTGGKYHTTTSGLWNPQYIVFDLPLYFRFGNHEIQVLNSYRKYYNNWTTRFKGSSDYGHYETYTGTDTVHSQPGLSSFFYNGGAEINYELGYYDKSIIDAMWDINSFANTPFYASNTIKYKYSAAKWMFTAAWQSYMMVGISTLGNGPLHDNLGVYSETSANPNISRRQVGRLDQDRAYVAWLMLSYRPIRNLAFSLVGKWKDGQPFSHYNYQISITDNSKQIAIWNKGTKGINVYNGDFGSREDMFFNFDLIAQYRGRLWRYDYEIEAMVYNIYDFGTELTEYTFSPPPITEGDWPGGRFSLSMCIPRGLMISAKVIF